MAKKKKEKIKRTSMSKGQAQTWISNIANQVSELTSSQFDILAQEIGLSMSRSSIETYFGDKCQTSGSSGKSALTGTSFLTWARGFKS
ncbi:hypothetical protein BDZ89DRAFT_1132272 [Hymenopellis radicata]|nr:hypothetical protein BDZ89DRAFT_1132272 [Hymenopellis radicata]